MRTKSCFRFFAIFGLTLGSVLLVGCNGDKPPLGDVEGTVTYKGTPVANGTITFVPEKGRSATGTIKDGQILNVTCFDPNDGAPIGKVKVSIQASSQIPEGSTAPTKSLIPANYANPDKSNLKEEIKSGKNVLKFELQ